MKKIPLLLFLILGLLFVFPLESANAHRCIQGVCTIVWEVEDVEPNCSDHEDCAFTWRYWDCDGPDCEPGTIMVAINPCKLWWWCQPVIAINECYDPQNPAHSTHPPEVTTAYEDALLNTPWDCNMKACFFGDCTVFYPECARRNELCPSQD